jgi:hypothetical protein
LFPELVLDLLRGPGRLRGRIVEAAAAQTGGDSTAETGRDQEEDGRADEHRFAVGDGEPTETTEHSVFLPR